MVLGEIFAVFRWLYPVFVRVCVLAQDHGVHVCVCVVSMLCAVYYRLPATLHLPVW